MFFLIFANRQLWPHKIFGTRVWGPLKCAGPCSAEHVRTFLSPALQLPPDYFAPPVKFRAVRISRPTWEQRLASGWKNPRRNSQYSLVVMTHWPWMPMQHGRPDNGHVMWRNSRRRDVTFSDDVHIYDTHHRLYGHHLLRAQICHHGYELTVLSIFGFRANVDNLFYGSSFDDITTSKYCSTVQ